MRLTLLLLLFVQFGHAQRTISDTYTYVPESWSVEYKIWKASDQYITIK